MAMDRIFELADRYKELKEEKDALQGKLKELNKQLEKTNDELTAEMVDNELQNFQRGDRTFYLQTKLHAHDLKDKRDQLYEVLRKEGYGDLIKETVNPKTLESFVREQIEENEGDLPEWIREYVSVYEKDVVGMRKA